VSWEEGSHKRPEQGISGNKTSVRVCAYSYVQMRIPRPLHLSGHRRVRSLALPCSHYPVHTWVGSAWACGWCLRTQSKPRVGLGWDVCVAVTTGCDDPGWVCWDNSVSANPLVGVWQEETVSFT